MIVNIILTWRSYKILRLYLKKIILIRVLKELSTSTFICKLESLDDIIFNYFKESYNFEIVILLLRSIKLFNLRST